MSTIKGMRGMLNALSLLRTEADAAFTREKALWAQAVRIASAYPVSTDAVRSGLDFLREEARRAQVEMTDDECERLVRLALDEALMTRDPHPQYGTFYRIWKEGKQA